jgi:hypothetical protein
MTSTPESDSGISKEKLSGASYNSIKKSPPSFNRPSLNLNHQFTLRHPARRMTA